MRTVCAKPPLPLMLKHCPDDDMTGHLAPEPEPCPSPRSPVPADLPTVQMPPLFLLQSLLSPVNVLQFWRHPTSWPGAWLRGRLRRLVADLSHCPVLEEGAFVLPLLLALIVGRLIHPTQIDTDFHSEEELEQVTPYVPSLAHSSGSSTPP